MKLLRRSPAKNLGMILLAVWLILTGLIILIDLDFSGLDTIMGLLAVGSGGMLLFDLF